MQIAVPRSASMARIRVNGSPAVLAMVAAAAAGLVAVLAAT
ncbi:MAG TPA: hypothetical protein VGG82_14210 [Casimicrobiaceae bacterium]